MKRLLALPILTALVMFGFAGTATAARTREISGGITRSGSCQNAATTDDVNAGSYTMSVTRVHHKVTFVRTPGLRHEPRPASWFNQITASVNAHLAPNTTYQMWIVGNNVDRTGTIVGCMALSNLDGVFTTDANGNGFVSRTAEIETYYHRINVAICPFDPTGYVNCIGTVNGVSSPPANV